MQKQAATIYGQGFRGFLRSMLLALVAFLYLCSTIAATGIQSQAPAPLKLQSTVGNKLQLFNNAFFSGQSATSASWLYESELEEDDEFKKVVQESFTSLLKQNRICTEFVYTGQLYARFLQLLLKENNRPFLSYFILYHSWKSYLS